jgi:hypothetical protein
MPRRSSGLSCCLQTEHGPRSRGASRPVHFRQASRHLSSPSRPLHLSFVSESCILPAARHGHAAYPLGWRRIQGQGICEDGGSVAVAGVAPKRRSSPALCTTATRYSPALPRGCNRPRGHAPRRPIGRFAPAPVRPKGLPPCLRVAPDDRFAATGTPLRLKVLSPCPVPADFASRGRTGSRAWYLVGGAPASLLSPPSSETGGRGRPFISSGRHLRDAPPRRSPRLALRYAPDETRLPFAPSPSRPLTRTPGCRTASPSGRDRPVGRSGETPGQKLSPTVNKGFVIWDADGDRSSVPMLVSACCLFPRSRRFLVYSVALKRGLIQ